MVITTATLTIWGSAAVLGVFTYFYTRLNDLEKFKANLTAALERSHLTINIGKDKKERPIIKQLKPTDYGYYALLKLPIGVTIAHALKSQLQIEGATNSNIEMWAEGQTLNVKFYAHRIPASFNFNDKMLSDEPLGVVIGYGKRGKEILNFGTMPNPNVLIGGMAGMGKSVLVHNILTQLILKGNTELYLIDTKRVEFNIYEGIALKVAKSTLEAMQTAREVVNKLNEREKLFDELGFQNIHIYNKHHEEKLPYTFLVIDEFGDFAGKKYDKFWDDIGTIARKGRALGIYLILSTQRPDVTVLDQQVKANLGTQIAFKTSNSYNSEIILGKGNIDAVHLPMKSGRCYMNDGTGIWELQTPYLSREQHEAILKKVRG